MNTPIHPTPPREIAPPGPDSPAALELRTALDLVDTLTNAARIEGKALAGSRGEHAPTLREAFAATDAARRSLFDLLLAVRVSTVTVNGGAL